MAVAAKVSGLPFHKLGDGNAIWSDGEKCQTFSFSSNTSCTGVLTSPNYPGNYPDNLEKIEMIEVEEGLIISLQFTAFDIEPYFTCGFDHLTITDGDGTTLMEKSCGSTIPADIRSTSNIVKLVFITGTLYNTGTGWSVNWSAVTPGECQQHLWMFLANFSIIDD